MDERTRYSPEVRERTVRLVQEHQAEYGSQWAAIQSIAAKVGCPAETLRRWVRQDERDGGRRRQARARDPEPTRQGLPAAQGPRPPRPQQIKPAGGQNPAGTPGQQPRHHRQLGRGTTDRRVGGCRQSPPNDIGLARFGSRPLWPLQNRLAGRSVETDIGPPRT